MKNSSPFPYHTAEYETIPCNFCGGTTHKEISKKDRNNLPVRTVICTECGLIFINPRMTEEWYVKYYDSGEYRAQMARFKGTALEKTYSEEEQIHRAEEVGKKILDRMGNYVKRGMTIEVGSGTGGVLKAFKERYGVPVLGIEPSPDEARVANAHGIETRVSMFEHINDDIPPAANVLNVRTLNHLLDPYKFLLWANKKLKKEGILIFETLDFLRAFEEYKSLPQAIQIDHVYMFTKDVMRHALSTLGFEICVLGDSDDIHMYVIAEKKRDVADDKSRMKNKETYEKIVHEMEGMANFYPLYFFRYGRGRKLRILRKHIRTFVKNLFKTSTIT